MSTSGVDAPALALTAGRATVNTVTGAPILRGAGFVQTTISISDMGTAEVFDPSGLPAYIALTRGSIPWGDEWQSAESLTVQPDGSACVYSKVDADDFAPGAYFAWVRVIVPSQGQGTSQGQQSGLVPGQELVARAGVIRVQAAGVSAPPPPIPPARISGVVSASGVLAWPPPAGVSYLDTSAADLYLAVRPGATASGRSAWLKNAGTHRAVLTAEDGSTFDGLPALTLNAGDLAQIADYSQGKFALAMTSLKPASSASAFGDAIDPPASTSGSPLAVPAAPVSDYLIERTLSANQTDYAYSANQGGRILKTTYANNELSSGTWTVYAPSGETFQTTEGGAGLARIVLLPGESRTMQNISTTVAKQI